MFTTRHSRVAGLGNPAGSNRAANLLFAIRTIQDRTGKDLGATFLSGTTISNSLTELYLLFKYLRPQALAKQDINCFDAWAAVFAQKSTDYEFSVTNQIIQKERFRYFIKVPELAMFYNEITDYRTADSIGVDRPDVKQEFVNLPMSGDQMEYMSRLVAFAAGGPAELIGRAELNDGEETARMLLTTNYANKMSLDMRIIDDTLYDDDPINKATACAGKIAELYNKYDEQKGTQFVFSDLSVYKPDSWNIYSEIKRKLVEDHALPENEIKFIQDAANEKQRDKLIADVNAGKVRVVFGSTQKWGTGVNAQKRVVGSHNLDCPWTPKDLKQRRGRSQRTGNYVAKNFANNTVMEYIYAKERSLDSYKFGILMNKQLFIDQIKSGTLGVRRIDEGAMSEDGSISYAEMAAITSGNTDLLDLAKLDKKIASLESERSAFIRSKGEARYQLDSSVTKLNNHTTLLENFKSDKTLRDALNMKDTEGNMVNNPISVDGALNSTPKAIAMRLHELEAVSRTQGGYEHIGTLGGFNLYVKTETYEINKELSYSNSFSIGHGKVKYNHNNGKMPVDDTLALTSFARALDKIEGLIDKSEKAVTEAKDEIPLFQKIIDNPFSKEVELQAMRVERDTLDRKIQLDLKPVREEMARRDAEGPDSQGHYDKMKDKLKESYIEKYGGDDQTRRHLDSRVVIGGIPKAGTGFKM